MFSCRSDRNPCCGPKMRADAHAARVGAIGHVAELGVDRRRVADEADRPAAQQLAIEQDVGAEGHRHQAGFCRDPSGDVRGDQRVAVGVAGEMDAVARRQALTPPGCARRGRAGGRDATARPGRGRRRRSAARDVTNSLPGVSTSPRERRRRGKMTDVARRSRGAACATTGNGPDAVSRATVEAVEHFLLALEVVRRPGRGGQRSRSASSAVGRNGCRRRRSRPRHHAASWSRKGERLA